MTQESLDPISALALVPYPPGTTPSQRFRLEQWAPQLRSQGVELQLSPFVDLEFMAILHQPGKWLEKAAAGVSAFVHRTGRVAAIGRFDAVIIHRAVCLAGPAILERVIRMMGRPIIFDFDDAIYLLHTTESNKKVGWLKFPNKTEVICRLSDHVVVGNPFLADFARQFNRSVTVVPSSVDTERFHPREDRLVRRRIVIGWTGSSTSQTYLERFAPVIRELIARTGAEFCIHSDRRPSFDGIPFVWKPWLPESEASEIADFDIGLMPMPDEPWAYGKCAMKALLYMACGVATVAQNLGANREVIQHGQNGLLASSPEEWVRTVQSLAENPELRLKLGAAGRRTVEESYSMERSADLFAGVVRTTVEEYRGRRSEGRGQ